MTRRTPILAALFVWFSAIQVLHAADAVHPGIPAGAVSNPNASFSNSTEALAMMMQVVSSLDEKVRQKELDSIHSEDLVLRESRAAILQHADLTSDREQFRADVVKLGQHVAQLHTAGDLFQQDKAEREMRSIVEVFGRIKGYFPKATQDAAQSAATQYCCPGHNDVKGARTDSCPRCGSALSLQVRVLPAFCSFSQPARRSAVASIRTDKPLAPGEPVTGFLKLTRTDRSPVYPSDLMVTHTAKIHLLIIDSSLKDYHHVHPEPNPDRGPGQYVFSFTPRRPGSYLAWADVRLLPLAVPEYAWAKIHSDTQGEPLTDREPVTRVTVEDLNYELTFAEKSLKAGVPVAGRLRITRKDGTPFAQLEPLMEAFAHFVGFHEDARTVLHLHPKGLPVKNSTERGGPELEFQFYSIRPGFVRLFAQVQIGGVSKYVPFGVEVVR